jgi:hypothetical protein
VRAATTGRLRACCWTAVWTIAVALRPCRRLRLTATASSRAEASQSRVCLWRAGTRASELRGGTCARARTCLSVATAARCWARAAPTLTRRDEICPASAYGDDEAISLGVGLYEVREGPGIEAAKGDTTWIKQVNCAPDSNDTPQEEAAINDLEGLVRNHELTPDAGAELEYCFSYSAPVQGQYLEGCVDECRSFQTLDEAEAHCNSIDDCGGVTHSLYGEGQSWHEGNGPFEVRQGPTLKPSKDGDISWIRIEHPCDEVSDEDGLDVSSLEASVRGADRSLMSSITYLIAILAAGSLVVYVAYMRGHEVCLSPSRFSVSLSRFCLFRPALCWGMRQSSRKRCAP